MQKIHLGSTYGEVTLQFDIRRWSTATAPKVTDVTRLEVPKSTPVTFWGSTPTQGRPSPKGNESELPPCFVLPSLLSPTGLSPTTF